MCAPESGRRVSYQHTYGERLSIPTSTLSRAKTTRLTLGQGLKWVMIGTDTVTHLWLVSNTNLATWPVGNACAASSESGSVVLVVGPVFVVVVAGMAGAVVTVVSG